MCGAGAWRIVHHGGSSVHGHPRWCAPPRSAAATTAAPTWLFPPPLHREGRALRGHGGRRSQEAAGTDQVGELRETGRRGTEVALLAADAEPALEDGSGL